MRAMVWTVLRGDAATARGFAAEIAAFAGGPLRDLVLGAVAETSDEPATAARLLESAWRAVEHTAADPDLVAIIAVLIGIHHYGQLDGAATVRWCTTALSSTSHPSIRSVARDLPDPRPGLCGSQRRLLRRVRVRAAATRRGVPAVVEPALRPRRSAADRRRPRRRPS